MLNKSLHLKYNKDSLQKYYEKLYNLENLEKNYFSYLDFDNFYSFSKSEILELKNLTKKMNKILKKAYSFHFEKLENNLPEFYEYKSIFKKSYENIEHLIARYDVLLGVDGKYKFIEINANTPGLINDIYHISRLNKPEDYKNINSYFKKHIKSFFEKYKNKQIGILLPYSYEDEDFLTCIDYKNILEEIAEKEVIIGDIYETNIIGNDFFTIKGEKVDVLLNFFPIEFFLTDKEYFESFIEIVKKKNLLIQNGVESIILQDKAMFSTIWENIEKYSIKEREFIKNHIPFTTRIFQENSNIFIAKDRFGRIGRGVYENNFYFNIDNKEKFIFQEKVISQIIDDEKNFAVLGLFTNMEKMIALIGRKQIEFVSKDGNNKIVMCYEEK